MTTVGFEGEPETIEGGEFLAIPKAMHSTSGMFQNVPALWLVRDTGRTGCGRVVGARGWVQAAL